VAKAMDYGQWQYENKKKQHDARKKQHIIQVKELKFRPNTDDHDYEFKKNHAIRFLKEGNRVKAVVQFRGREIAHVDLGKKLLLRFAADLASVGTVEGQPRLEAATRTCSSARQRRINLREDPSLQAKAAQALLRRPESVSDGLREDTLENTGPGGFVSADMRRSRVPSGPAQTRLTSRVQPIRVLMRFGDRAAMTNTRRSRLG